MYPGPLGFTIMSTVEAVLYLSPKAPQKGTVDHCHHLQPLPHSLPLCFYSIHGWCIVGPCATISYNIFRRCHSRTDVFMFVSCG